MGGEGVIILPLRALKTLYASSTSPLYFSGKKQSRQVAGVICSAVWNPGCFWGSCYLQTLQSFRLFSAQTCRRSQSHSAISVHSTLLALSYSYSMFFWGYTVKQANAGEMLLLQPQTTECKFWLIVSLFLSFCSQWPRLITGITSWKWASICRCFCVSQWMSSEKWDTHTHKVKTSAQHPVGFQMVSFAFPLILCLRVEL